MSFPSSRSPRHPATKGFCGAAKSTRAISTPGILLIEDLGSDGVLDADGTADRRTLSSKASRVLAHLHAQPVTRDIALSDGHHAPYSGFRSHGDEDRNPAADRLVPALEARRARRRDAERAEYFADLGSADRPARRRRKRTCCCATSIRRTSSGAASSRLRPRRHHRFPGCDDRPDGLRRRLDRPGCAGDDRTGLCASDAVALSAPNAMRSVRSTKRHSGATGI